MGPTPLRGLDTARRCCRTAADQGLTASHAPWQAWGVCGGAPGAVLRCAGVCPTQRSCHQGPRCLLQHQQAGAATPRDLRVAGLAGELLVTAVACHPAVDAVAHHLRAGAARWAGQRWLRCLLLVMRASLPELRALVSLAAAWLAWGAEQVQRPRGHGGKPPARNGHAAPRRLRRRRLLATLPAHLDFLVAVGVIPVHGQRCVHLLQDLAL